MVLAESATKQPTGLALISCGNVSPVGERSFIEMDDQGQGRQRPPVAYSFVAQSGRKIDQSTQGTIRSHAMREFRNRQRQDRQQRGVQPVSARSGYRICRCPPSLQSSSADEASSSQNQGFDTSSEIGGPTERCHHCGGIQLSNMTPPQQVNILQKPASTVASFAAADFDPFNSIVELPPPLTSKFSGEINAVKAHAITFCSPGATKTDIFPEALRTPALLSSILYMAYSFLCAARGWSNPELALGLKGAAISEINRKMLHPSTATCTNVIASISYLSIGTWVFGNPIKEVETHLTGIELMVNQRGMDSLGVYQFGRTVRKYLFVQHILLAAIRVQSAASIFNLDYQASNPMLNHESPLFCPRGYLQPHGCSEETTQVLNSAKSVVDAVIGRDEGLITEEEFDIRFFDTKSQVEQLSSSQDPFHNDWIFESCRLTVWIMLTAIETRQPLVSSDTAATIALVQALQKTGIGDNWGELSGVLFWVSMIGSASSQRKPGHRILDAILGRTMAEIAFTAANFGDVVEPVRRFAKLQMALKKRGEEASEGSYVLGFSAPVLKYDHS
ncbi:hypothetical protein EG329_011869 [Mollisiaceae sp. DMI_Dod_QoI]|nr:hypothetical protein EG329_011869 [Helotiales sp. DMI_Dod_QoI]